MVNAGDEVRRFGRYEVERELGRGAMGTVYLAHDPVIGRRVAIKAFRPQPFGSESDEQRGHRRIIREAESAGALSHPNIVTLYDIVDAGPHGESFLTMEYVEGPTLAAWRHSGEPIAAADVAEIVAQAGAGLDYAHAVGVVHRDIKPANLLLAPGMRVKIADFGIAKLVDSELTQEPEVLGTPNYMPPEVMEGERPDRRGDIYALGVVAYELLTGQLPFAAPSLAAVVLNVMRGQLALAESVAPELPAGTGAVLQRAMHRDPAQRHATATEFARELALAVSAAPAFHPPATRGRQGPTVLQGPTRVMAGRVRGQRNLPNRRRDVVTAASVMLVSVGALGFFARSSVQSQVVTPAASTRTESARAVPQLESARSVAVISPSPAPRPNPQVQIRRQAREDELARRRERVQAALAEGKYAESVKEIRGLLELGPPAGEARALLLAVETGLARSSQRVNLASATPVSPERSGPAEVEVAFQSALEDGVLTIYAGSQQLLRARFKDLGSGRADSILTARHSLSSGKTTFRAYTTIRRQPAQLAMVEADLKDGERLRLAIRQGLLGPPTLSLDPISTN